MVSVKETLLYTGERGYSLREVAEMTGVKHGTLEHWKYIGVLGGPIPGTGRKHARYDDDFVRQVEYTKRHFRDNNCTLAEFAERQRARRRGARLQRVHPRPRTVGVGEGAGVSDATSG